MSSQGVIITILNDKGNQIEPLFKATKFEYVHSEETDDSSRITLESNDVFLPDHPDLQEDKKITVSWGYTGAEISEPRVLYIFDTSAEFKEDGISISLRCFNKAAYLKIKSRNKVRNSTNLRKVATDIAQENGLNYKEQLNGEEEPILISSGAPKPGIFDVDKGVITVGTDNTSVANNFRFREFQSLPQANKSDDKHLKEITDLESQSNVIIDGRDEDLIVKRRDFKQRPYKTFAYKSEPGNIIKFSPNVNNRSLRKSAINTRVSGWDPLKKRFLEGNTTHKNEEGGFLGNIVQTGKDEKFLESNPEGEQVKLKNDTSIRIIEIVGGQQGTFDFDNQVVTNAIDTPARIPKAIIVDPEKFKEPLDNLETVEQNVDNIAAQGINKRSKAELNLHKSNMTVVGDPSLISGKVITVLNVSRKFSGNYYVSSVTHSISSGQGYLCQVALIRNARGKTGGETEDKLEVDTINKPVNREVNVSNENNTRVLIEEIDE